MGITCLLSSGFFFGFLLGLLQMFVWLLYDKPWTLPAGGAIVGYITNWVALKLIFEPVDPMKIGPFVLQGLFLKRQNEVWGDVTDAVHPQKPILLITYLLIVD